MHFRPQLEEARRRIVAGEIGEIESIYLTNISLNPIDHFPNWGDPVLSYGSRVPIKPNSKFCRGGAITDHPHPYDLIRWITGREFATVSAVSARNQWQDLAVEDHAAITASAVAFYLLIFLITSPTVIPFRRTNGRTARFYRLTLF